MFFKGDGLIQRYHFVVEFFLPVDPGRSQVDVVESSPEPDAKSLQDTCPSSS